MYDYGIENKEYEVLALTKYVEDEHNMLEKKLLAEVGSRRNKLLCEVSMRRWILFRGNLPRQPFQS